MIALFCSALGAVRYRDTLRVNSCSLFRLSPLIRYLFGGSAATQIIVITMSRNSHTNWWPTILLPRRQAECLRRNFANNVATAENWCHYRSSNNVVRIKSGAITRGLYRIWAYIYIGLQVGPKSKPHYKQTVSKPANEIKLKCQRSSILSVGIKYSLNDPISNVSYCALPATLCCGS